MEFLKTHIVKLFLCVIVSLFTTIDLQAQKTKKHSKNTEASKLREAEFYFTEGEKYYILEDYAKALALFQKSSDILPENATLHYKMAQIYSNGENNTKAIQHINQALILEQKNKYFYELAADINTQSGNYSKASEWLEKMIVQVDNTDQYLFELAALYLYQNRFDDALSSYSKIEERYGISEEIVSQKQLIYLRTDNIEQALDEGQKLIENFPGESRYALKQAEILMANDKTNDALKFLESYLIENEDSDIRLVLSEIQRQTGKTEEAMKNLTLAFADPNLKIDNKIQLLAELRSEIGKSDLKETSIKLGKQLIQIHPEVADAHAVYGDILYAVGNKKEAKSAYETALQIDDSNFSVWQNIIQILSELNKTDSIILITDQAMELFPNQGVLYYYNGSANLRKRNYQDAIYSLEYGKKMSTANLGLVSAFNSMLGDAYNGVKDYEKSDRAFEAALDFDPNDYGVLNNYSYFLALRNSKLSKAETMSAKTVKENPDNLTFIDTYAWVLYKLEKYKEAKKVMEKALEIGNISAIHHEHYGDILYQLGNVDGAVEQWKQAKVLNPNAKLIDKKIETRKLYE